MSAIEHDCPALNGPPYCIDGRACQNGPCPLDLAAAREAFIQRFEAHKDSQYPQYKGYFRRPGWRLARVIRNTGYRGDRWFEKGDIILACLSTPDRLSVP